ncbi:MAG: glycosyltransferase family 61 protein [Cytophagaceae bacterium]
MNILKLYIKNAKYLNLPGVNDLFIDKSLYRSIVTYHNVLLTPTNHIFVSFKYIPSGKYIVYDDKKLSLYQRLVLVLKFDFFKKYTRLDGDFIWVYDLWSCNYYHWFSETLPRIVEIWKSYPSATVILPDEFKKYSYIENSLSILSIPCLWIEQETKSYKISRLHTVHDGVINDFPDYDWQKIMVTHIKSKLNLRADNGVGRRIYVSRSQARYRKIINEAELIPILKEYGYEIIYAEQITLKEQIAIFSQANFIVSMHGAALTNMIYMNEGAAVLEIRNQDWESQPLCFFQLANNFNIQWNYMESIPQGIEDNFNNVKVDVESFRYKLNEIENLIND